MDVLVLVLLALAAVAFGLAAGNVATRVNLLAVGLLLWVFAELLPRAAALA